MKKIHLHIWAAFRCRAYFYPARETQIRARDLCLQEMVLSQESETQRSALPARNRVSSTVRTLYFSWNLIWKWHRTYMYRTSVCLRILLFSSAELLWLIHSCLAPRPSWILQAIQGPSQRATGVTRVTGTYGVQAIYQYITIYEIGLCYNKLAVITLTFIQ